MLRGEMGFEMAVRSCRAWMINALAAVGILCLGAVSVSAQTNQTLYFEVVFDAIKRNFPVDFDRIAKASHGPDADSKAPQMIADLFKAHLPDIAHAPSGNLLAIAAAERDFIVALQKQSVALCALYG